MTIDIKNTKAGRLNSGMNENDFESIKKEVLESKKKFQNEKLGFTKLPYQYNEIKNDIEFAKDFSKEMDTIVVVGIGGSDLGLRAIHRALNHQFHNQRVKGTEIKKIYFAGDTTDPETISQLSDVLNLSKTLFIVISKSGNTIEQASVFAYFRDRIISELGKGSELKHFLFLTDPKTGTLRELSTQKGYKTIDIPSEVGGRFSVLSSVGIIPASLIGIDVEAMLNGAREFDTEINKSEEDEVLEYVAAKYYFYKKGKDISVLMPYQYSLYEFAKWYQQLWAESLGKKLDLNNNVVNVGQTPTAALGPVDQHSQLQLFNEGPNDKFFTFIRAEKSRTNLDLPKDYSGFEQFEFFKGRNFQEILNYEQETTAFSLTKNDRPNTTISISEINAFNLGKLFYFFEVATSYFGNLLNINTFDQPGVELSKNAMYGVLEKKGYEEQKKEFEEYKKS